MNKPKVYSVKELIGKGDIALYGKDYKLQKEAYLALEKMRKEARRQGVKIRVISAYRNFAHQNKIWTRKYKKFITKGYSSKGAVKKVKEYTAIPGTSRHHWGTDVDLSNGETRFTNHKKNTFTKWMDTNAHKFGYYRVYTNNKLRSGYNYESWHYTYRRLAKPMLEQYIKLNIIEELRKEKIKGNQHFTNKFLNKYIENHVLSINDYLY